jgi:hypothetical protein
VRGDTSTERGLGVAGFGGGFAAVFGVFVGIAVAGSAGDDAAGAAQAGEIRVRGAALDAADPAVLGVICEHGFAVVGRVSVAVGGTGHAILEAPRGGGIGGLAGTAGLGVCGFARAICRNGHRDTRGTAAQTQNRPSHVQHGQPSDAVLHPPVDPQAAARLG